MNPTDNTKKSAKLAWPGRKTAIHRVLLIAAVLFPCTWIVNAFLVGSWNLLGDRNAESFRHLREAVVVYVCAVCIVFLVSLLPSLQRFSKWMSSWRVIRRGWITLGWLVTIIVLFYGEESWRGHRAWTHYSEALTAQGAQLEFKAFVPKPVLNAENFAATPEIQSWFVRNTNAPPPGFSNHWAGDTFSLANAMISSDPGKLPPHLTDLVAWQMAFAAVRAGNTNPAQTFNSGNFDAEARAQAARSVLEELKPVEARLEELHAASSRPESLYPVFYDLDDPWGILLPHLSNIKSVCLHLDLRACAELAAGESDRALDDVKLILRMGDSLKTEPFLMSYLVRVAALHIAVHSVWEGLQDHRWSDAQLKELEDLLGRYDFIADLKTPLDSERAAGILTADLLADGKFTLNEIFDDPSSAGRKAANAFGRAMPGGWWEIEKLNYGRLYDLQLKDTFDPRTKRVFAHQIAANSKALDQALGHRGLIGNMFTRHQLLAVSLLPALGGVPRKGAIGQVAADEAALACALERYRIAHGQFPDKLDTLVPDFIFTLPHDVITGDPYKYQRTADDFLLYSVGWNETDDGGKVVLKGSTLDFTEGDWVWQK